MMLWSATADVPQYAILHVNADAAPVGLAADLLRLKPERLELILEPSRTQDGLMVYLAVLVKHGPQLVRTSVMALVADQDAFRNLVADEAGRHVHVDLVGLDVSGD